MRSIRYRVVCVVVGAIAFFSSTAMAVNCCSVNGGTCNIIPPLTHGQTGWTGAVCGTTLTGTNCTAKLDADVTATSGDCITVGSGVTLDLNGHELECTSGACGTAVKNTTSGGASGAVVIKNGDITGPWNEGIFVQGGTNSSVSDVVVDGSWTGILYVRGPIDHAVVRNCASVGVVLQPGEDISNSILRNNGNGDPSHGGGLAMYGGNYGSTTIDNVLFTGNYWSIINYGYDATMQRSELQDAGDCHCYGMQVSGSDTCRDVNDPYYCPEITNATTPTMVDDAILP